MSNYIYIGQGGNKNVFATYWELANTASGTITPPPRSTIKSDSFQDLEDALASEVVDGKPTFNAAVDSSGMRVVVTMDAGGNFTLSPVPDTFPVAIVYRVIISEENIDYNSQNIVVEDIERPGDGGGFVVGANLGSGSRVYKEKIGSALNFRTLTGGNGVSVSEQPDTIHISSTNTTADKVSDLFACSSSVTVGDLVAPSEAVANEVTPLTSNVYDNLCFGVVVAKPTSTSCEVLVSGKITGLSGLPIGQPLFVGTDGKLTAVKPVTGHIQAIGMSISSNSAFILPQLSKMIQLT